MSSASPDIASSPEAIAQSQARFNKLNREKYFKDAPYRTYVALTGKSYIGFFDNLREATRVGNLEAAKLGETGLIVRGVYNRGVYNI